MAPYFFGKRDLSIMGGTRMERITYKGITLPERAEVPVLTPFIVL